MADTIINFTIPEAQIIRAEEATKWACPITQIADPQWINPQDGSKAPLVNEFTDNEWIQEALKKWIIDQVYRFEQQEAVEAIDITKDKTLVN